MAETMAPTNGIPDSTTMSTLDATTHIPIAQLTPLLPAPASRSIKAIVTLTWPYSSRTDSVAFTLAEPDFRLRRIRGQVRVQFSGSSANVVAKSGITNGDEVILCLDGVEYIEAEATNATPGKGVEFELKFVERLLLQFRPEGSEDINLINIDHPDSEPVPTPAPAPTTEKETEIPIPEVPATPAPFSNRMATKDAEEYFSPMFLKRERTSYGSMFEEGYDPFEVEDGSVRGKGRKRTRLSTTWRFASRSPSPSPEVEEPVAAHSENGIQEPAMTDEAVQTMEVETEVITEATQTLDQSQSKMTEENEVNGTAQVVHAEARLQKPQIEEAIANTMPPPPTQSDTVLPEIEQQVTLLDDIVGKLPSSPQLRPLSSEGLPLVSPLVTNRFEIFNNHIHNDQAQNLEAPNASAVPTAEADMQIQTDAKEEDLYIANPPHHTSDQPNSDHTSYQTSTILSGNKYDSPNMEAASTPHKQAQFDSEEGTEQFFPSYDVLGPDPYTSAGVNAGIQGEQGRSVPDEIEEGVAQYNYPDPEQTQSQSNNWGMQSSITYPDLEDSDQQAASHSPYPQLPSMSSMVRSQSKQSHQSHQVHPSHQSPQPQVVDLTESDDEDAEGFSEVEDNSQQHMTSSHLPVGNGEAGFLDEEEEEEEEEEEDDDEDSLYGNENKVDDYGESYSDEYDENMDSRSRGNYSEEDENGSEDGYDADNYSEDGMINEEPLQPQAAREPEVIDLLSSDDEGEEQAPTLVAQIRKNIEDNETIEVEEETEEDEDEDEDEDEEEDDDEGEDGVDEILDVVGDEVQSADIPTTKSEEFVIESSDASIEEDSMENESAVVNDCDDTIKTDVEMPEMVSDASESSLDAQVDVDTSLNESKGVQQSPLLQESFEEEAAIELESTEPMDVEISLGNPSAVTDKIDTDNTTDNLDGLFEKLEEAGSETQLEQGSSNTDDEVPQNDAENLEDIDGEDIVPNSNEANTEETPSHDFESTEPTNGLPTAVEIPNAAIPTDDKECTINAALQNSPPSPIAVEIPSSVKQSIIDRAAKSGWANSSKKSTFFAKTLGLDGANDTSDEGDEGNKRQISYPGLPVAVPEDQQESIDEAEQISQIQNPIHGIDTTTNHRNDQLLTPDDAQKINPDEDSFTISDLLQSQLQEEMGEMDEDLEIIQTDESMAKGPSSNLVEDEDRTSTREEIDKDQDVASDTEAMDEDLKITRTDESMAKGPSKNLVEDEDQTSTQEEIDKDQDVAPDTEAMDEDDVEMVDPELEDFEVQVTKTEIIEMENTESTKIEVEQVDGDFVENDNIFKDKDEEVEKTAEKETAEEETAVDETAKDEAEVDESGEFEDEDEQVEANEGGEFEFEKSEVRQIEADIRKAEMTEFETQQTLVELADNRFLGLNTQMIEVSKEYVGQTVEETEAVADKTEAIVLEQIRGASSSSPASLRSRNRKESLSESQKSRKQSTSVSPRRTRSSKEPSPELRRNRKGLASVSPKQTRSKILEPVVETIPPVTPTKSHKYNERPSTVGSNRSERSPSIVLDEENTPQGHDASAEMALESLELPESPTKAGHHLRAPARTDPKLRLNKYIRTDLSEYTTLKILRFKLSSKVGILAIATSVPPEPQRAKSGPRHYEITFTITDQTIAPSKVVEVKVFRPYKDALPTPEIGDGILLRDFRVQSVKGTGFTLRSEEGSSWAVFKDEGTEIEVRGPRVEYGHGEKKHIKELREWFHALDDDQKTKIEKASTAMEKGSPGKNTPEKGKK